MDRSPGVESSNATAWWEKRRRLYNVALVLAGLGAFACYAVVVDHFSCSGVGCSGNVEKAEITPFTIAFQGMAYLIAIAVANVLFGLGAFSEQVFRPQNVARWRRTCFVLGLSVSVMLPFFVPALVAMHFAGRR